ncbi:hypothetical protein [Natronorubrum sp. FCH18a]|uniref:hypothetical protein n=1 Tax=Natronorubrum sp. FCH18a TaxID=3447018 RepID=UPI003F51A142
MRSRVPVFNLGHGVRTIADAAYEQLQRLEYTSSMRFVTDRSQEYADRLAQVLPDWFDPTGCSNSYRVNYSQRFSERR